MLRLSKLTDYGTVIMTHMAREPDRICSATEVAVAIGVPVPTASKILKMLARQNLLQSLRGAERRLRVGATAGRNLDRPGDQCDGGTCRHDRVQHHGRLVRTGRLVFHPRELATH